MVLLYWFLNTCIMIIYIEMYITAGHVKTFIKQYVLKLTLSKIYSFEICPN